MRASASRLRFAGIHHDGRSDWSRLDGQIALQLLRVDAL
jgi:hypothetical protein